MTKSIQGLFRFQSILPISYLTRHTLILQTNTYSTQKVYKADWYVVIWPLLDSLNKMRYLKFFNTNRSCRCRAFLFRKGGGGQIDIFMILCIDHHGGEYPVIHHSTLPYLICICNPVLRLIKMNRPNGQWCLAKAIINRTSLGWFSTNAYSNETALSQIWNQLWHTYSCNHARIDRQYPILRLARFTEPLENN